MKHLRAILITILILIGLTNIWGGYGLITTNGIGMPVAWLAHSPFPSFIIPGVILIGIVGGTNFLAAYLLWNKHAFAYEAAASAGFGLQIWIFVQMYIIRQSHPLQAIYFALGTIILITTMLLLKSEHNNCKKIMVELDSP